MWDYQSILPNVGFTILLSFIVTFLWKHFEIHRCKSYLKNFPGPETNFLLGNAEYFKSSADILPNFSKFAEEYGRIFLIWIGPFCPNIIITDRKLLENILCSSKNIRKSWQYRFLRNWLGLGLLLSEGLRWKKRRKILTPAFHFQILPKFVEMFERPTKILIKILRENMNSDNIDIYPLINLFSLDIMCETSFGTQMNAQENKKSEYVKAVKEVSKIMISRSFSAFKQNDFLFRLSSDYYKEKKAIKILHEYTNNVIKSRRERIINYEEYSTETVEEFKGKKMSLIDILLLSKIDNQFLTDEMIREEVDTFLFEGHDTTTSAISFTLYLIANHPDVQEKIVEEQKNIYGFDKNPIVSLKDLQNMEYLSSVIHESLRLFPSVPVYGRELVEDINFDGKLYPRGTNCIINAYGIQRDPEYYPNPEIFNPTRFLEKKQDNNFTYLPFSAGQRNCIGQKFALLEMKYVLSSILRNFYLRPAQPFYEPLLVAEIILKSKNGIRIAIRERK